MNLHELTERNNLVERLRRVEAVAITELMEHRKAHGCAGIGCADERVLSEVWASGAQAIVKAARDRAELMRRPARRRRTSHQG